MYKNDTYLKNKETDKIPNNVLNFDIVGLKKNSSLLLGFFKLLQDEGLVMNFVDMKRSITE